MPKTLEGNSGLGIFLPFHNGLVYFLTRCFGRISFRRRTLSLNKDQIIQLLKDKIQEYTEKAVSSKDSSLLYTYAIIQSELSGIVREIEENEE
jgi:hypothetical protein